MMNSGVIFSDDLTMEGASLVGGFGDRALAALGAGCHMVLVCNHRQGALEVLETLTREQCSMLTEAQEQLLRPQPPVPNLNYFESGDHIALRQSVLAYQA